MTRRKLITGLISLAALYILAPVAETKADTTDTSNNTYTVTDSYTVEIPSEISIDPAENSADFKVNAELDAYNELDISVTSQNVYQLKCGDSYGLSYALTDESGKDVQEITYSTKDATGESQKNFSTKLKAKLADDAVATVSGTYEDILTFEMTCKESYPEGTYKLTYDATGGTVSPSKKALKAGEVYGELPTPTREGYIFAGWYTEEGMRDYNGKQVTAASVMGNSNTTIYAHWGFSWTVKYDANGGSGEAMSDTQHGWYTGIQVSKNTFTRDGYTFKGWYMSRVNNGKTEWSYGDASGTWQDPTQWYEDGAAQTAGKSKYILPDENVLQGCTYIPNDVITLHAVWEPNTYTVKYDNNSLVHTKATGTMDDSVMTYDSGVALSTCTFLNSDTGAHFVGWNTAADGSGTSYDESDTSNLTSEKDAVITLYAQWEYANIVEVRFEDVNGNMENDIRTISETLPAGKEFAWSVADLEEHKTNQIQWEKQWQTPDNNGSVSYITSNESKTTTIDIKRQIYYLDLNSQWYDSDGKYSSGGGNLIWNGITAATVTVEVNGKVVASGVYDYFVQQRYGSTFKFTVTTKSGYKFKGITVAGGQESSQIGVDVDGMTVTGIVTGERHVDNSTGTIGPYYATTVALNIQKEATEDTSTENSSEEQAPDKGTVVSDSQSIEQDMPQSEDDISESDESTSEETEDVSGNSEIAENASDSETQTTEDSEDQKAESENEAEADTEENSKSDIMPEKISESDVKDDATS